MNKETNVLTYWDDLADKLGLTLGSSRDEEEVW